VWEKEVEDDEIGTESADNVQAGWAVVGDRDPKILAGKAVAQEVGNIWLILDDGDVRHAFRPCGRFLRWSRC
jgi:hypothetical protein